MKIFLSLVLPIFLSYPATTYANNLPQNAPDMFNDGPPAFSPINLSAAELAGHTLMESMIQLAVSAIFVNSCKVISGTYSVEVSADGSLNNPEKNVAKLKSPGISDPIVLNASLENPDLFRGQIINIKQEKKSILKETPITDYTSVAILNKEQNLLLMNSSLKALGSNNVLNTYQNSLIKNIYLEQKKHNKAEYLFSWGIVSLSIEGYPINKYWARSKSLRSSKQTKRMMLINDRLIGSSSCRILIDSSVIEEKEDASNENQKGNLFRHKGILTITEIKPNDDLLKSEEF